MVTQSLAELQKRFRAGSNIEMPLAGILVWSFLAILGWFWPEKRMFLPTLIATGMIFWIAFIIGKLRGKNLLANDGNPLTKLFLQSILLVLLFWPFFIIAVKYDSALVVLGIAIAAGVIWIPFGWAAGDNWGLIHGVARAILCYAAYFLFPNHQVTAISLVVVACYVVTLIFMMRKGTLSAA